jgi:uncharacterized membrane protein
MLCDYSEILGKIEKGVHSYRILDVAIMDVVMTMIGAYSLQKTFLKKYEYYQVLLGLFLLGIALHRLFCVRTTVDKLLFP